MRRNGYLAAAIGWSASFAASMIGAAVAIDAFARSAGGERWGFEFLLLIPWALVTVLLISPFATAGALRLRNHDLAHRTALLAGVYGVAAIVISAMVAASGLAFMVPVALLATPFAARATALRSPGKPPSGTTFASLGLSPDDGPDSQAASDRG